ncbi:hypothetical protein [Streptomyces sp. NPDC093089]|uniref:hypothetical protein n=1 Tax=Streptomyces sp. NPDC093089 TaxID=3366024 RepID=UPI0038271D14
MADRRKAPVSPRGVREGDLAVLAGGELADDRELAAGGRLEDAPAALAGERCPAPRGLPLQAVVAEVLPDQENRAKDLGFLNVANTMPQLIAPIAASLVVPAFGHPTLFVLAIVLTLAGGLCILPLRRVR